MNLDNQGNTSLQYVYDNFSQYYKTIAKIFEPPSAMEKREFAFSLFKERIMLRHKGFKNQDELIRYLGYTVPLDAYHSCAYYADPTADMDKKGWQGADLIFDIDADHIPTPCNKIHDEWSCITCGFIGKGIPEKCPICGGERFDIKTWPCEECLNSARNETAKLLNMLMHDFGFSGNEIRVFFSGHRGYHVYVESEIIRTLDAVARSEIVSYVSGLGLDLSFFGLDEKKAGKTRFPRTPHLTDPGWRGRLAKAICNFILNTRQEDYIRIGLKKHIVEKIMQNKNVLLKSWEDVGPFLAVKGVGVETWRKVIDFYVASLFSKIDTVVTTDIHRLIRMNGTLHGKTGLKKVEFPVSDVEVFDPFKSAIAFRKGTAVVYASDAPRFRLGGEEFGPYRNQKVELPTAAAILLVCKKRAEVVAGDVSRTV